MIQLDLKTREYLLERLGQLETVKEDYRLVIEGAAAQHDIDKAVLRKVVAAWYAEKVEALRDTTEQTLELIDSDHHHHDPGDTTPS